MKIFEVEDIVKVANYYSVRVPGKRIYAVDARHAYYTLGIHGRGDSIITNILDVELIDPKRGVILDSLLMPSKLQLN